MQSALEEKPGNNKEIKSLNGVRRNTIHTTN